MPTLLSLKLVKICRGGGVFSVDFCIFIFSLLFLIKYHHSMKLNKLVNFEEIISIENLLFAWKEFLRGKRNKKDVQEFQLHLMDNILSLHNDLKNKTYIHGGYYAFNISDPKPRNIHKASVRDRLLHHAIYRILYPYFDKKFIHDSYSCR